MPRGRSNGDRVADLESRLEVLEELRRRAADSAARQDYSAEEVREIGLILLENAHDGDTRSLADWFVRDRGLSPEEAAAVADWIGRTLEEQDGGAAIPR